MLTYEKEDLRGMFKSRFWMEGSEVGLMGATIKREMMVPGTPTNSEFYWVNDDPVSRSVYEAYQETIMEMVRIREERDELRRRLIAVAGDEFYQNDTTDFNAYTP